MKKWIDNSQISTYERCPREWYLRYHLGLKKPTYKGLVAQEFGKAFHRAIELFFKSHSVEECIEIAVSEFQETLNDLSVKNPTEEFLQELYEDPRADVDLLSRTIGYFLTEGVGKQIKDMTLKAHPEVLLSVYDPRTQFHLIGRIDLIIETFGESKLMVDIKTTRYSIQQNWTVKAQTDTQLGFINAVSYAVLRVDRRKLKSGVWSPKITLESDFFPVAITRTEIQKALFRFRMVASEINSKDLDDPMNFPCRFTSCQRFNSACQFHPLCQITWNSRDKQEIQETAQRLELIIEQWSPAQEDELHQCLENSIDITRFEEEIT